MAVSWEQALVDSQCEVNRAVFELNRRGALKSEPWYIEHSRPEVIREHATEAIKCLRECLSLLPGSQLDLIAPEE